MKSETSAIECKAIFSDDKSHRMLLRHEWEKGGKSAMIIMINPNTADTLNVDLTTMLTINNLSKLGFGSVNIVNLYSQISPKLSLRFNSDDDLIDSENDKIIEQYAAMSDAIIIAWGSVGRTFRVQERQKELLKKLEKYSNKFYQIGEEGFHPLTPKVRNNWELIPYEMEEISDDENY